MDGVHSAALSRRPNNIAVLLNMIRLESLVGASLGLNA